MIILNNAKFKFKHAVMTAGKSRELARVHYNYRKKGEEVLVLVPSTDNRHGAGVVTSRSGEKVVAVSVEPGTLRQWLTDYFLAKASNVACILTDEAQFWTKDDIFGLKEIAVIENDVPVIAYGLKNDFQNNLFEGSAAALVVAEKIEEIETLCAFCNRKAAMNLRLKDGVGQSTGDQVEIGYDYKPVCHRHYLRKLKRS